MDFGAPTLGGAVKVVSLPYLPYCLKRGVVILYPLMLY